MRWDLGLHFVTGEGPQFHHPVQNTRAIKQLAVPDIEQELGYVTDAVRLIRRELDGSVPLIGFSGSPWTLATYMVEGGSSRQFPKLKELIFNHSASAHQLLDVLARSVTEYLNAQIAAGAQAVMIFDTWGGALNPRQYQEFSLDYMAQIITGLKRESEGRPVPVVLFTKGAGANLKVMADSGCDALGVDWTTDLAEARRLTADKVALQGNLDPCTLYASPEVIRTEAARVLDSYGDGPGHVFNLGHGISPDMNPAHLAVLVETVHELSRRDSKQTA